MSFGAGHAMDMINRMKQNRALLHSKNKFKENGRIKIPGLSKKESREVTYKKLSKEEFDIMKEKVRQNAIKEQKRERIINTSLFILFILLLTLILIWSY